MTEPSSAPSSSANLSTRSVAAPPEFARIKRLPPYVFNITGELKMAARRAGEDIIDMSMGNPDGPTPPHIVAKMVEQCEAEHRAIRACNEKGFCSSS